VVERWEKLGLVYVAQGEQSWAQTRAYLPASVVVSEDRIRVFVAFLDSDMVGRIGFVDVATENPTTVLAVSEQPALDVGDVGMFDDAGVNPLSVFGHQGRLWMYYVGWQRSWRAPYLLFTGLAYSDDGGLTFERHARVPVLDRTNQEPMLRSGTFVTPRPGGGFRAWYVTGDRWIDSQGKRRPAYEMRYIESPDGVSWPARGTPCLRPAEPDEYGFGRPFVLEGDGYLRMWYSIRTHSRGYRLGYAESADGLVWERRDGEVGIDVSAQGWDSGMIHCGWLQSTTRATYLFYNGNRYGATGFGVAALRRGGNPGGDPIAGGPAGPHRGPGGAERRPGP
jgi:hypothetical protein